MHVFQERESRSDSSTRGCKPRVFLPKTCRAFGHGVFFEPRRRRVPSRRESMRSGLRDYAAPQSIKIIPLPPVSEHAERIAEFKFSTVNVEAIDCDNALRLMPNLRK